MTESENRFTKLAEIFITQDPNSKDHVTKIMLAKGVIIQMESDLVLFEKSKGQTEKSKEQAERIRILKLAVDTFSAVSSNNLQVGYIMYQYHQKEASQALKIADLELEILLLKKQLEFT